MLLYFLNHLCFALSPLVGDMASKLALSCLLSSWLSHAAQRNRTALTSYLSAMRSSGRTVSALMMLWAPVRL